MGQHTGLMIEQQQQNMLDTGAPENGEYATSLSQLFNVNTHPNSAYNPVSMQKAGGQYMGN